MSSERKIAANRANARRSTGPNSAGGKAAAKHNALRHGLTSKEVVLDNEDPAAFEALRADLMNAYRPADAAESTLVEEVAVCFWRLKRARALEAATFTFECHGADPIIGFNAGHVEFDRLRRYMTTIERAYHRALEQLQRTQRERSVRHSPDVGFVSQKVEPFEVKPSRLNRDRTDRPVIILTTGPDEPPVDLADPMIHVGERHAEPPLQF